MPKSWMGTLSNARPEHLSDLLVPPNRQIEKIVWPLSLLALRNLLQRLCISRNVEPLHTTINRRRSNNNVKSSQISNTTHEVDGDIKVQGCHECDSNNNDLNKNFDCSTSKKIGAILMKKKIKAKKRHEIERMSQLTAKIANESRVKYIVDFGSGLGHLARLLAYGYGLNVCCLEKEHTLTDQAK